ncbi:hypothetical protein [Segatella maculosa]|jgi:hypothetical protein|uniref:hypothetical protein n=1 Tax=Segatella maculosa TaxID=439703 RepID=UPI0024904852|nr:hypothetical protein [Segatella maculosa]
MAASVSIASEYGKVQDLWRSIERDEDWRLVIWEAQVEDVDIVDKFMEVERSPVGEFSDVFFRFDAPYKGNVEEFTKTLWEEYVGWFDEKVPEEFDIMAALRKDGRLLQEYHPDSSSNRTAESLWNELLRFKNCIKGLDASYFCIYIPPTTYDGLESTDWFRSVVDHIPQGIRLVTVDFAKRRKVKLSASQKVRLLKPKLNMADAIRNEMDKECGSYDPTNIDSLYTRQIRTVMDCTAKQDEAVLDKEVGSLLGLSRQLGREDAIVTTPMIAAQAYYIIRNNDKSLFYCDQAIKETEKRMKPDDMMAYSVWKVALFQKAAILVGNKKRKEAIGLYEHVATEAARRADVLYVLEGYRMSGFLNDELGKHEEAFIRFLLALEAGSHLDISVRRTSTFVYAASMAMRLCRKVRGKQDLEILESQLEQWLGTDWHELTEAFALTIEPTRHSPSLFSRN